MTATMILPIPMMKILEYTARSDIAFLVTKMREATGGSLPPIDIHNGPFSTDPTPTTIVKLVREQQMMMDYWQAPEKETDHGSLKMLRFMVEYCVKDSGMLRGNDCHTTFLLAIMEEGQIKDIEETNRQAKAMMLFQSNPLAETLMNKVLGGDIPLSLEPDAFGGKGLVANRDIKIGEVVALYAVDWTVNEDVFEPDLPDNGLPKLINALCGSRAKFANLFCLPFGYGNASEPENMNKMIQSLEDYGGIVTTKMRSYGLNLDVGMGTDERTCVWADPDFKHVNPWMIAHMANDGIFKKGMKATKYNQAVKIMSGTNMTLGLVCRARCAIKAGETVTTHYGADYWFSGKHAHMASLKGAALQKCITSEAEITAQKMRAVLEWKTDIVKHHINFLKNMLTSHDGERARDGVQLLRTLEHQIFRAGVEWVGICLETGKNHQQHPLLQFKGQFF
tara:strand:- start:319 stop:1668 length:1350 start_codon:yes stop_codon:yes gene_type:complete